MRIFSLGSFTSLVGFPFEGARRTAGAAALVAGLLSSPGSLWGQHPGELVARVVDAVSGAPVAGARVVVPAAGLSAVTDGDGSVHFRGLEPGEIQVQADRFGYRAALATTRIRNGRTTRFELSLAPLVIAGDPVRVDVGPQELRVRGREELRRAGARTLGDALAGMPGVVVVRRGAGGAQEVRLRGGGPDQVLILVDGVVLNDPLTGTADLSTVAVADVERIQVLPGARTARYGAGALAGVVLVETRRGGAALELVARTGSLGERGIELGLDRGEDELALQLGGSIRRVDGAFDFVRAESLGGGEGRRHNADVAQWTVRAGAQGRLASGRWSAHLKGEEMERGIPGKSFAPSTSARQRLSALTALARWVRHGEVASLSATLHHGYRRVRFADPAPPLGVPFDHWSRLNETGGRLRLETGAGQGGVGSGDPAPPENAHLGVTVDANRRSLEGDALNTDGALRHSDVALAVDGSAPLTGLPGHPRISGAARGHRDGRSGDWLAAHDLSIRASWGSVRMHASHRSSFSPPSAGDLFFREGVGIRPNPDLRPERVPSELEVGASVRVSVGPGIVQVAGELFAGDLEDMIVWAPDFRFVWSPRNVDVSRKGAEVRGELRLPAWGVEAGGHVADVEATYHSGGGVAGVQVIYRPRRSGGAWLGWQRDGWHVRLDAVHTGRRYPVPAAVNALDPFWTLDLSAGGELARGRWRLEPLVRVERLLDERAPFIHAFPEPGRTLLVELRARIRP